VLAGLSPARRRLFLVVAALLLAALAALTVVVVSRATAPASEPVAQERPGPVLVVPGYGGSTNGLRDLAARLVAAGRDTTVVALPANGTGDLAASADALDAAVAAALERTGDRSVDVVGFSAGGVVARLWVADGGADVARRVVTLGSPHHGTTLADLAGSLAPDQCPVGCLQLTTGSDLLTLLNAGDETPGGTTWVSIWTTQDETVTPPDSARLEGALNLPVQSVCADARLDHGDLVHSPLVAQMVLTQLGPGEPVPLDESDCARLGG
jgi:triacylglycerol lipase